MKPIVYMLFGGAIGFISGFVLPIVFFYVLTATGSDESVGIGLSFFPLFMMPICAVIGAFIGLIVGVNSKDSKQEEADDSTKVENLKPKETKSGLEATRNEERELTGKERLEVEKATGRLKPFVLKYTKKKLSSDLADFKILDEAFENWLDSKDEKKETNREGCNTLYSEAIRKICCNIKKI